jgi:hypothetical protein
VKRTLAGAEESTLLGIRRRITNGSGHLTTEALLGETSDEPKESGPIF